MWTPWFLRGTGFVTRYYYLLSKAIITNKEVRFRGDIVKYIGISESDWYLACNLKWFEVTTYITKCAPFFSWNLLIRTQQLSVLVVHKSYDEWPPGSFPDNVWASMKHAGNAYSSLWGQPTILKTVIGKCFDSREGQGISHIVFHKATVSPFNLMIKLHDNIHIILSSHIYLGSQQSTLPRVASRRGYWHSHMGTK